MRPRFVSHVRYALLLATGACAADVTSVEPAPRTFVSQRVVGDALPAKHFCTAASSNTEQWVSLHRVELAVDRGDGFVITAIDEQGNAQFTINDAGVKTYTAQMVVGGARSVSGTLLPAQNGIREARVQWATSMYGVPADFTARVYADSAIVTDQVHCLTTVGTDSSYVFTAILK